MSRRRICYWPGQTDSSRDWLLLDLDLSDEDLTAPRYSRTSYRYSPTRIASTTPSSCYCSYHRSWRCSPAIKSGYSKTQEDKDGFKVPMSRRRICYWPGQTDWSRDWLLLNLGLSDEDLNVPRYTCYNPTSSRYSSTRLASSTPSSCCCTYHRPWRYTPAIKSGYSKVQEDKDGFKVTLDVKHFKDGEIKVKTVGNQVVVEAQHDERQDEFGYISRSLKRKYSLPDGVDAENVKTELSSDGVLTIFAPNKEKRVAAGTERLIPILKTSKPALTSKKKGDQKVRPTTSTASAAQDADDDDGNDDDDDSN